MSARETIFSAIGRALGKPADAAAIRAQADALLAEPAACARACPTAIPSACSRRR